MEYYTALQVSEQEVLGVSEEEFAAMPKEKLIALWLQNYSEEWAEDWLEKLIDGMPLFEIYPIQAVRDYYFACPSGLSAKEKMMYMMESPLLSNEDIAIIGF